MHTSHVRFISVSIILFTLLSALFTVGYYLGLQGCPSVTNGGAFASVAGGIAKLLGGAPQAPALAYARAVARGDVDAALALWELPDWEAYPGWQSALAARREVVTRDLAAAGVTKDVMVLRVEWWRTCCEPGVTCDARDAGGARLYIQFMDQNGMPLGYIFDVFVRGTAYWGAAAGYPLREWVLRDVYPREEEPLFWRLVYEPRIKSLAWPP